MQYLNTDLSQYVEDLTREYCEAMEDHSLLTTQGAAAFYTEIALGIQALADRLNRRGSPNINLLDSLSDYSFDSGSALNHMLALAVLNLSDKLQTNGKGN